MIQQARRQLYTRYTCSSLMRKTSKWGENDLLSICSRLRGCPTRSHGTDFAVGKISLKIYVHKTEFVMCHRRERNKSGRKVACESGLQNR